MGVFGSLWEIAYQPLRYTVVPAIIGGPILIFCFSPAMMADSGTAPGLAAYAVGTIITVVAVVIMKRFKKEPPTVIATQAISHDV